MTNHIAYTYNTVYSYVIQALFTRIRFHRETLLFSSVSAYRLHVNEQNAPGKCCVWKTDFKVDLFKNATPTSSCKREKQRNASLN